MSKRTCIVLASNRMSGKSVWNFKLINNMKYISHFVACYCQNTFCIHFKWRKCANMSQPFRLRLFCFRCSHTIAYVLRMQISETYVLLKRTTYIRTFRGLKPSYRPQSKQQTYDEQRNNSVRITYELRIFGVIRICLAYLTFV